MPFTAIIPARGGSRGLPGKNLALLAGKPLWQWSLDQARAAGAERVIVTTDIAEILGSATADDLTLIERPSELSQDTTPMAPVLMHALADAHLTGQTIVLLQPTSPLRSVDDIRAAVALFEAGEHKLVMTVTEADRGVLKYGLMEGERFSVLRDPSHCFSNRQALPPVYRPTGAVYVFERDWFLNNEGFETDRIGAVQMPPERAADIDTQADLERAAKILARF